MLERKHGPAIPLLGILLLILLFCPEGAGLRAQEQEKPSPPVAKAGVAVPPLEEIEKAIFEFVNRERAARGLSSLKPSSALTILARKHSEDMAGRGLLSHLSAAGMAYTERLEAADVFFAGNGENVARSDSFSPGLIHQALMKSEGHRENILQPEFDELGVGIVRRTDGVYYVTQDFITGVRVRDEAEVRTFILASLDKIRQSRGLAPLLGVDDVHETAQAFAEAKSEGRPIPAVPSKYGETRVSFFAGPHLDDLASALAEVPSERYGLTGVGVRFARTRGYPGGAYFLCVFFLAGDPELQGNEQKRIETVLAALNAVRAERGRQPLPLDPELSRKALELGLRYQKNDSRIALPEGAGVAVFYRTSSLDRIATDLQSQILKRAHRKVGVSVRPVGAGTRLDVNFIVVLVFE